MSAFDIPPPQIDPAILPPPIMTSERGSFARHTFEARIPAIVSDTMRANVFPREIERDLEELREEIIGGAVRGLREDAEDTVFWNRVSEPHIGRSWLDVPWYWAEAFFYRRLLEATRYSRPGSRRGFDPFKATKHTELDPAIAPRSINGVLEAAPPQAPDRFKTVLYASLWGNRIDQSYRVAAEIGRGAGLQHHENNLALDDADRIWAFLSSRPPSAPSPRRLAMMCDNAGTELMADLALADFLLQAGVAASMALHLKPQPFFVSDATGADLDDALDALPSGGKEAEALGERLRTCLAQGRLTVHAHWFSSSSLFYFQLPEDLRAELASKDLVILKGDANYRRLLGDAHWPPTTLFERATGYFPAPLAALRTLKAELIVGLHPGQAERLREEDRDWLINGRRGLVQARL